MLRIPPDVCSVPSPPLCCCQSVSFRLLIPILVAVLPSAAAAAESEPSLYRLLNKYCLSCHGQEGEAQGEVDLSAVSSEQDLVARPELIRHLTQALENREMPPEDEPQPTSAEQRSMVRDLRSVLRKAAQQTHGGHAPLRRLNRFQYNNAVTDLFDLSGVVFSLPERMMRDHRGYFRPETGKMAETVTVGSRPLGKSQMIELRLGGVTPFPQDLRAEHGFDNRGDHLSLSPLLMESFLKLGQSITQSPDFTPRRVGVWKQLFATPGDEDDLREAVQDRLTRFLTRAFRRPVEEATRDRYVEYVMSQIEQGDDFAVAMKGAAAAAIASPKFLYLYDEASAKDELARLDNYELASRLSFFLWGSIPDDELLSLAARGELEQEQVLVGQVERMLRDRKLKRFCDSFPAQWLQLERIVSANPDPDRFPGFYFLKYRDSMHMMLEPLLLFETVLIENLPITQFLDSDFTYRSVLLREAYGETVPAEQKRGRGGGVGVLTFERLPVSDPRYGGMITNAAVMTMTSGRERTQPITRGAWLATVIFNDPPEPPPADVPPLTEKPQQGEERLTLRERLLAHRERADCRGCHERIDPLGFALENFNVIGVWRDRYDNGRPVDATGVLFRTHQFEDVVGFKRALMAEKDRFAKGFAGHLLSFALARELTAADTLAVEKIVEATAADEDRIQTLIKQIVISEPFRHKSNPQQHADDQD